MEGNTKIHPTAQIASGATLGKGVVIEPYAILASPHIVLEEGVTVRSHAYIDGYTTIGEGTVIYPGAVIGTKTQDRKFRGERTFVRIGKRCEIREFVTINASCGEDTVVEVGDDCLVMAYCHIAHNCKVDRGVIMSNNATLAGHVHVEEYAIIGGHTPIHQFTRIGRYAMVGGMSRVTHDFPPFLIGAGVPCKFGGINSVGLKRHGFSLEVRQELMQAFRILYRSSLPFKEALYRIETELKPYAEIHHFLQFCRSTQRGIMGLQEEVTPE